MVVKWRGRRPVPGRAETLMLPLHEATLVIVALLAVLLEAIHHRAVPGLVAIAAQVEATDHRVGVIHTDHRLELEAVVHLDFPLAVVVAVATHRVVEVAVVVATLVLQVLALALLVPLVRVRDSNNLASF